MSAGLFGRAATIRNIKVNRDDNSNDSGHKS